MERKELIKKQLEIGRKALIEKTEALLEQGKSYVEISAELDLPESVVRRLVI